MLSFALLCAFGLAACATTGATATETADAEETTNKILTLEEALQKSAEARQKIIDAKNAYQNVKDAADASQANESSLTAELVKQAIQNKVDDTKEKIEAEKEAWKELFAD